MPSSGRHLVTTGTPDGRTHYAETRQSWSEEQTRIPPEVAPAEAEWVLPAERLHTAGITTVVLAGLATTSGVESPHAAHTTWAST